MSKFGFVYIWRDNKRKMYYIGCHWGSPDDGYICSSNRMRMAYNRRKEDFKRRIISIINTNQSDMFNEERRWLNLIPDEQLGKKYYNLCKSSKLHWSSSPEKAKSVKEKLTNNPKTKATWKKKMEDGYVIHNKGKKNPEQSKRMKGNIPWNKGKKNCFSEVQRQKMSASHKTPEYFIKMSPEKLSEYGRKGGIVTGAKNKGKSIFSVEQCREAQRKSVISKMKRDDYINIEY